MEEPPWTEEEEDILDLVLCANCGADNGPEWAECEICGEPLPGGTHAPPSPAEPAPTTARSARPDADEFDAILEDLWSATKALEPPPEPPKPAAQSGRDRPVPQEPVPAPSPPPSKAPAPTPRSPPPSPPLVRIAETPPSAEARTVPKPAPPARPAEAPREAPPPSRLVKQPAEIRVRRERAVRPTVRARPLTALDLLGPAVASAGIGLYASNALGQGWTPWAIAFVLAAVTGYAIAGSFPHSLGRLRRFDGMLLLAGAVLGALAPVLGSFAPAPAESLAMALAVASALPLAAATRRLLAKPGRDLLAAAAAVPLVVLAIAAGEGTAYARTSAWSLGVLASLPWPAALAFVVVRDRIMALAVRRELVEAEAHYERQDYAKSVEDYDRAIRLAERSSGPEELPWYGKGAALIILGRYGEALESIDRALDINPYNEVAWVNKGNALTKMGRLVDALRCFNAAIKVNPAYEVAWNNKGNALARLGRFEEALRCYEKALDLDPDYRGAWVNKGYVLAKLGRYDEAAACADRVLRLGERRAGPA